MRIWEKSLLLALVLAVLFSFSGFTAGCEDIPNHVLRLHVLANSDSGQDQALKLKVRDRVLAVSAGMMDGVRSRAEAETAVAARLPEFREAAEDEIRAQGFDYPVSVQMEKTYFPTKTYENVTLPAGEYDALRVVIGSGGGHNWWCVLFPPLCLPAAEDAEQLRDVLNRNELKIVQGEGGYQVKFKSVELFEQFQQWLRQHGYFA